MSLIFPRQAFSPSCKSGGTWYSCGSGSRFVGCCDSAPCEYGCPDGNLKPASFDKNYYGKFSDQQCPTGSRWYTCSATDPPFLGCCKSNPCNQNGCPVGDLTAGFLSSNPQLAAAFSPSGGSPAATSNPTASSKVSSSTPSTINSPSKSSNTGAIAGGTIAGVAAIALLIALLSIYCKKKSSKSRQHMNNSRVVPDKPVPMYPQNNTGVSLAHDEKKSPLQRKLLHFQCVSDL